MSSFAYAGLFFSKPADNQSSYPTPHPTFSGPAAELLMAIHEKDFDDISAILESNPELINVTEPGTGYTPLHWCPVPGLQS